MPLTQMSGNVTNLSRYFTYQQICNEAMVLTNTLDNENIQLDNVRTHVNVNISYLAHLLNLANAPFYGIWMSGTLETSLHASGLEWINMQTALNGKAPSTMWAQIKRINVASNNVATDWIGNCTKKDISEMTELNGRRQIQYRQSICWTHNGADLLFLIGPQITTPNFTANPAVFNVTTQKFVVWGTRKPVLDNLVSDRVASGQQGADQTGALQTQNYFSTIDLPDEYAELLIKMTIIKILQQMHEQIPTQLEQEVNAGLAMINTQITSEMQFEAAEREKRKYGNPQKAPGAM